jgi:hypothetical protein
MKSISPFKVAYLSFIVPLLIFTSPKIFAQAESLSERITCIAEELAADETDPDEATDYVERLQELVEDPVKINSSDENEISRLFFLSGFQVKALADYPDASGKILSIYEIASIPGFDNEIALMMIPFITLENKSPASSYSTKLRNVSITNLSIKPLINDSSSLGSQWRVLSKYKFTAGTFSGGFTGEKDPGEKFLSGTPPLPDFFSAYLSYNGKGIIRKIIIGDYSARFGQGINLNTGIRTGLSLTSQGYMSARDEIKPYTSTNENNYLRGIAAELSFKSIAIYLFYSKNYSDATLGSFSGTSKDYIENFYTSGLHNTSSLLQKKDAISDLLYGINLSYNFKNLKIGMAFSEDRLSLPVIESADNPEKVINFEGDKNNLYTIYYNSIIKRIFLYGDFSVNKFSEYAFVQGISLRPSDRLTVNFLYRKYSAGFVSFHGKGPGRGSSTGNEEGILGNFIFEAAKHLFISGGCDIWKFPWLRYRCAAPSYGMKQEVSARFLVSEKLTIDASFNYRLSVINNPATGGIPKQGEIISRTIKGAFRYSLIDNLTIGTRLDYKIVPTSGSRGMLMLQDINYTFRQFPVTIWLRYCLFDTDDYDSRIYAYENDLLYSFSIPAFSGEGSRTYLMAKWKISNIAEMRIKYGITSLNTGTSTFENKEELKMQFRLRF